MMEENAQMSLLPDAVGATQMTMTGEEEIDLSEYEISCSSLAMKLRSPDTAGVKQKKENDTRPSGQANFLF